ncbi:hypothetical protein VNO77_31787 [Canavalia gladiata]|uniref:Uncharacterized protein n=1 Tax=Canavalia gladiata TaxID=3824 RepID=A0AAN9KT66_CANGL
MELQDTAASRVSIGFPLGLALLFICLLFICGFFCCCLHWNKIQYLFPFCGFNNPQSLPHAQIPANHLTSSPQKPAFPVVMMKQNYAKSLPVLMPGDDIPKFIATACPCQPPRDERITIHVEMATTTDFCSGN